MANAGLIRAGKLIALGCDGRFAGLRFEWVVTGLTGKPSKELPNQERVSSNDIANALYPLVGGIA